MGKTVSLKKTWIYAGIIAFVLLFIGLAAGAQKTYAASGGIIDGTDLSWQLTDDGELIISGTGAMCEIPNDRYWQVDRYDVRTVTLGDGVTSIGVGAFDGCANLETVNIGNGSKLSQIDRWAFSDCTSLESLTLPDTVSHIDEFAFTDLNNLKIFVSDVNCKTAKALGNNKEFYLTGNEFFAYKNIDSTIILVKYCGEEAEVTVPDFVKKIGDEAFYDNAYLTVVNIPSSVTEIREYAFWGCIRLEKVSFAENSRLSALGRSAFSYCAALTDFNMPANISVIEQYAFNECTSLRSLTLPGKISSISEFAFDGDNDLKVFVPDEKCNAAKAVSNGKEFFVTESEDFGLRYVDNYLTFVKYAGEAEAVVLPDYVQRIDSYAFDNCTFVKEVSIPVRVTDIYSGAFEYCPLQKVNYAGTVSQWANINVDEYYNDNLFYAPIYCTDGIIQVDLYKYAEVSGLPSNLIFNGNPQTPEPTVEVAGRKLINGTDYELTYTNNIDAGQATVTVTGIGDYCNSQDVNFNIGMANQKISAKVKPTTVIAGQTAQITVTGAKTALTYVSGDKSIATVNKSGKVTAKGPGTVTITVTAKETNNYYSSTAKVKLKVNPATPKATKLIKATGKSKSAVVTWKKGSDINGYQLQYSTNSSFKSAKTITVKSASTTSATIKKLKKGKYYFRIRTYKTVSGKTYYSDWSASKYANVK